MIETIRHPRKWITVWVHGNDDRKVASRIESEIGSRYLNTLLEVFTPTEECPDGVEKLATPGRVFLRVLDIELKEFLDAVKRVPGVGGVIESEGPEDAYRLYQPPSGKATVLKEGDKVQIAIGPLRGSNGRVAKLEGDYIKVQLSVYGRFLDLQFTPSEVRLVK